MRQFILLLVAAVFLISCRGKSKGVTLTSEDGKDKVTVDVSQVASATDDIQKKMEELKKLAPLTTDQLKGMLPEEIMGLKRTNFSANSMMGFGSAEATYRNEGDEKEVRLSILDCAGEAGAGIYSLNYWTKMSMQSENDNGYSKTIDFNGGRAVESYQKSNDEYELTFVGSDRLLVSVKGEKIGLDAVKQVAKGLNLKAN
jgi:hypothetical protein